MANSPRVQHNADLAIEFMSRYGVTSRYPKVSAQVATVPIQPGKLVRFSYNPSIVQNGEYLLMAYRYHDGATLSTKIALAELTRDGQVISNRSLKFDAKDLSVEDPRLFWDDGHLCICWVESNWPNPPLSSVVKYGRIDDTHNEVVSVHQIRPKALKAIEKNFVPLLAHDATLRFIYECNDNQLILEVIDGNVVNELASPALHWPYGPIRGGTVPISFDGQLLRFFHSGLDNEPWQWRRRYYLGACLMDPAPPFAMTAISKRPIVYGSEDDDLSPEQRSKCIQYKGNVVFPGGAVLADDVFLVSVGINDSACAILKIKPEQLNF